MSSDIRKIIFEFESGRLKECDMTGEVRNRLIEFYKAENQQIKDRIKNLELILYKKYVEMKKSRI